MDKSPVRTWQLVLLTLFSLGWLLPLWWVGDRLVAVAEFNAAPHLFASPPATFIFIFVGREVFAFSLLWLAAVLSYWIVILARR